MKRRILIITGIMATFVAVARILPGDGQKQWRWIIDAEMPGEYTSDHLIDLSDAATVRAYETSYTVYGDTLVCRTMPGMRDWFVLRDGSLWSVGANDRTTRHAYTRGVMYLPEDFSVRAHSDTDTLTVTLLDSPQESAVVSSSLSVSPGPGFVLALGDTVQSTVEVSQQCVRTALSGASITTTNRRWYAYGCLIPVVEESGIVVGGEPYTSLTICPPIEQSGSDMPLSRGGGRFSAPARQSSPADSAEGCIDIVRHGDAITRADTSSGTDLTITVCDMQGRLFRTGSGSADISGLPPGWYIVTAYSDTETGSVKFRID